MKFGMIVFVLAAMLVSGCTSMQSDSGVPEVKTQEEAQKVVENVTQDVSDMQQTLSDIDQSFG